MYRIENFELSSSRVVALQAKAGCVIRVTAGRLWITVQGHPHDIWLQAGERWTVPLVNAVVWLSAEPSASFQMARTIALRRRLAVLRPLALDGVARWWRRPVEDVLLGG